MSTITAPELMRSTAAREMIFGAGRPGTEAVRDHRVRGGDARVEHLLLASPSPRR